MIPLPPLSVKFPDEERARLKALAATLGWPESQIVRDAVAYAWHLIHQPKSTEEPKFIILARLALCHRENPALLQQHLKQIHLTIEG